MAQSDRVQVDDVPAALQQMLRGVDVTLLTIDATVFADAAAPSAPTRLVA